ncbi:RNA-directed DNA polymerase, eukaryota, reverse transcriptase zinc-binding domain protein [Tanacetum coccineum]
MWSRCELKEVIQHANNTFFFKFATDDVMKTVLENGPWMVRSKPLLVQKWEPDVRLDKIEPVKLPLWVKMFNVPLEAWSVALASGDAMTTTICHSEDITKYNKQKLQLQFRRQNGQRSSIQRCKQIRVKYVPVEYAWKPDICEHCNVFGHKSNYCKQGKQGNGSKEEIRSISTEGKAVGNDEGIHNQFVNGGFTEVQCRKKQAVRQSDKQHTDKQKCIMKLEVTWDSKK